MEIEVIKAVFFFKQKTAYEMLRSLVGSEMCIRDRDETGRFIYPELRVIGHLLIVKRRDKLRMELNVENCLLYTSDAADDLLCVDLGGRRIIKKKNMINHDCI